MKNVVGKLVSIPEVKGATSRRMSDLKSWVRNISRDVLSKGTGQEGECEEWTRAM